MSKPREFWLAESVQLFSGEPIESATHVIEKSAYDKALKALCHVMIDFHADEKVDDDVHDYIYGVLEELGEADQ